MLVVVENNRNPYQSTLRLDGMEHDRGDFWYPTFCKTPKWDLSYTIVHRVQQVLLDGRSKKIFFSSISSPRVLSRSGFLFRCHIFGAVHAVHLEGFVEWRKHYWWYGDISTQKRWQSIRFVEHMIVFDEWGALGTFFLQVTHTEWSIMIDSDSRHALLSNVHICSSIYTCMYIFIPLF